MIKPNPNNEIENISNIKVNIPRLRRENDIELISSYVSQSENDSLYLESFNVPLINNLPIFAFEEKGKINNTIKDQNNLTEERQLYLIDKKLNNLNLSSPQRSRPFKILNKKKNRGRERVKQEGINENENENEDNNSFIKIHDKNVSDNLLRKIQVHFLSFIIQFLNEILCRSNYNKKFLKLNYKFKSNIKKDFVNNNLKTKTIGEIICNSISHKYTTKYPYYNKNIYEETKGNEVLNMIYSKNYLLFFREIYFKSERIINLKNKIIILSDKVKMFKDLIKTKDYIYNRNLNDCVNRNFFPNSLFKIE